MRGADMIEYLGCGIYRDVWLYLGEGQTLWGNGIQQGLKAECKL